MRITYAYLKGCKRFTLSNITEIEAHFKSAVQVIVGTNGSGKSSFLQELCPIPSARTDYHPGGKKILHIEHEGRQYILESNFSNKSAPHSFLMDGEQLNISGTTGVQTELVETHFGITSAIRNLIYAKTPICRTTEAERKNLFLNINPMKLGLILDTHKKTLGKIRDCKANLQLLHSRKADLEGKILADDILNAHITTKEKLTNELLAVDKIIYGLEQHIGNLAERFREDLDFQERCVSSNTQIIPSDMILSNCRRILNNVHEFRYVERGDAFEEKKSEIAMRKNGLTLRIDEIKRVSQSLAEEINEYHKHLETATSRPISEIEKEIADLDFTIQSYTDLPENPIPAHLVERHSDILQRIREILFVFRDSDVKMINPKELSERFRLCEQAHASVKLLGQELAQIKNTCDELEKEIEQNNQVAQIPQDCAHRTCGLRNIFSKRSSSIEEKLATAKKRCDLLEKEHTEKKSLLDIEIQFLRPFNEQKLLERFKELWSLLSDSYFRMENPDELVECLRTQPMMLIEKFTSYIEKSIRSHELVKLTEKKTTLTTELEVIMKSSGASLDFLKTKLQEKELSIQKFLHELQTAEAELQDTNTQYNLYLEYSLAVGKIEEFQKLFSRGERAILVSKALQYWKGLKTHFTNGKLAISEKLRSLETLVREQETLRNTYQNETVKLISVVEKERSVYEKMELALSPTTGIPHRSMVKYLNALIHNVNYFLSQIWAYRMHIFDIKIEEPLNYSFPLETPGNISNDISQLSDGQKEVMNIAWILTILLQLKMLNKVPFFADEIGRTFDPIHRMQILSFLGQMLDNKIIEQLFIVNHFALFTDGFGDCDIICLNPENIPELPKTANENVRFA